MIKDDEKLGKGAVQFTDRSSRSSSSTLRPDF
jgi:hypothetical protein